MSTTKVGNQYRRSEKDPAAAPDSGVSPTHRELEDAWNELVRDTARTLAKIDRLIARLTAMRDLIVEQNRSTGRATTRGPLLVQAQPRRNPKTYEMLLEDERRARLAAERDARK